MANAVARSRSREYSVMPVCVSRALVTLIDGHCLRDVDGREMIVEETRSEPFNVSVLDGRCSTSSRKLHCQEHGKTMLSIKTPRREGRSLRQLRPCHRIVLTVSLEGSSESIESSYVQ